MTTPTISNGADTHETPVYVTKTSSLKSTFSTHDAPPPAYRSNPSNNTQTPMINSVYNGTSGNQSAYEKRQSSVSTSSSEKTFNFGVSEKCARCQKSVYAAEKIIAASKSYHKLCFTCNTCKKSLSSMSCCDNSDGDIFCKGKFGEFYKILI